MKKLIAALTVGLAALYVNAGVVVSYWDFGPDPAGYTETVSIENALGTPTLTDMSAGTGYDADGQTGTSFTDAEGVMHSAGQALAWSSGVDDGDQRWTLSVDLTGYQDLTIRWDYRSTSTGPSSADLSYQVADGGWLLIESISFIQDSEFHEYSNDLSLINTIENQSNVQFRLSSFSGGSGSGTYRTDNIQLSVIPEPATFSLMGLSTLLALITRRASRA